MSHDKSDYQILAIHSSSSLNSSPIPELQYMTQYQMEILETIANTTHGIARSLQLAALANIYNENYKFQ